MQPNLLRHAPGFPTAAALRSVVVPGQPTYGMAAVGPDKTSPGAELIVRTALKEDARPLWVLAWGGTNTLAQALLQARTTRPPQEVEAIVSRLRVYSISDQDDAGPWIRREFPILHYVVPRPHRTASSTTSRPGRGSAGIASTAMRPERTSPPSRTTG